jgi:hypothetical protein
MVEAEDWFDLYVEAQTQADGGELTGQSLRKAARGVIAIHRDSFVTEKNCTDATGAVIADIEANAKAQCSLTNVMIFQGSYFAFTNASAPFDRQEENLPDMAWALDDKTRFAKRSYNFVQVRGLISL